jgi:polysaccharide biosynthesis/export protein
LNKLAIAALLLALTGCSSVPEGAPTTGELLAQDDTAKAPFDYQMFDITADVARVAGARTDDTFAGRFGGRGVGNSVTIGRGDTLSITIFEASNGGLFTSSIDTASGATAGAKNVTMPAVLVDAHGFIHVPYADQIEAAGHTPREIEAAIEDKLKGRAIEPQVIVSLVTDRSALVTVSGEVRTPSRMPMLTANERLLDAISEAGGTALRPFEATVTVVRGDKRATASLKTIFDDPRQNVFIRPGDTILVQRRLRSVTILGAESKNSQLSFDSDTLTLAEAIGNAAGLDDARATPSGVFVFRYERPDIIRRLLPGWSDASRRSQIPTLYKLDMRVAQGYFLAQQFQLRDKDLVFAANADGTQYLKVLTEIGAASGTVTGAAALAISANNIKSDIRLKHDIVLLGRLDDGLGYYRFVYNGGDTAYVGVMAQEVQTVMPTAVTRGDDGYLRVSYDMLGVPFETYDQWLATGAKLPAVAPAAQ